MRERKYKIDRDTGQLVKKNTGKPIPEDVPCFVLIGTDKKALTAIATYAQICDNLQHRVEVMKSVEDFRRFAQMNPDRMKEPDV